MIWYILAAVTLIPGLICLAIPLLYEVERTKRNILMFVGCALMAFAMSSVCMIISGAGA